MVEEWPAVGRLKTVGMGLVYIYFEEGPCCCEGGSYVAGGSSVIA